MAQHRSAQARILVEKILDLREDTSPLNIIYDSLEQSAKILLLEYIERANATGSDVVYVSFDAVSPPHGVKKFVRGRRHRVTNTLIQADLLIKSVNKSRCVIIFDSIEPFLMNGNQFLEYLSSVVSTQFSVVLVCHLTGHSDSKPMNRYRLQNIALLEYLATTIINVFSVSQSIALQAAATSSLPPPTFGLQENLDGALVGIGANMETSISMQIEHRRKSGRPVGLRYSLDVDKRGQTRSSSITILHNHNMVQIKETNSASIDKLYQGGTFSLTLTEEQRKARESVVLPYFDAQLGLSEGGRIVYDIGREDDFDEEEDEVESMAAVFGISDRTRSDRTIKKRVVTESINLEIGVQVYETPKLFQMYGYNVHPNHTAKIAD